MTDSPAIILAGGDPIAPEVRAALPEGAFVIAADSGLHAATSLRLAVHLVVGDLDSADPQQLAAARRSGAGVEVHPTDKNATDLELALEAALARDLHPVVLLGGASFDRIDHFMANALLLAAPRFRTLQARWHVKDAEVIAVHDRAELHGVAGDIVTLLPVGGPARGVTTSGLRWALDADVLAAGSTRGVSNEMTEPTATITLTEGTLLAVHVRSAS